MLSSCWPSLTHQESSNPWPRIRKQPCTSAQNRLALLVLYAIFAIQGGQGQLRPGVLRAPAFQQVSSSPPRAACSAIVGCMSCSSTAPSKPSAASPPPRGSPPPPPQGAAAPNKTPPPPPSPSNATKPPPPPAPKTDKRAVEVQPIPSVEDGGVTLPAMAAEDASGVIPKPARFYSYEDEQAAEEVSPPFTPQEADNPFRGLLAARALAQWANMYCVTCKQGMVATAAGVCGES